MNDTINAPQEELVTYMGKIVKKQDLAAFLQDCMIQVLGIMQTLNLEKINIEGENDQGFTKIDVSITETKRLIALH